MTVEGHLAEWSYRIVATDIAVSTDTLVQAALEYASYGWRIVPLYHLQTGGGCSCPRGLRCPQQSWGKHPRLDAWQNEATTDEERIAAWWTQWPQANVGVHLGPLSGVVDAEYDSEEGKRAAEELFKDCFTPTYKSGRSVHRIFKYTPDIPRVTKIERYGLEIRIGAKKSLQSVFPPSEHWSGIQYVWLPELSPAVVQPVEMPERIRALLWNDDEGLALTEDSSGQVRSREHWQHIIAGVRIGERHEAMKSYIGKKLGMTADLENSNNVKFLWEEVQGVNQRHAEALEREELDRLFHDLLRSEMQKRATAETEGVLRDTPEERIKQSTANKNWRLVIVESDPPRYELYAKQFADAENGRIVLTAEQMNAPRQIRIEALRQANYPMPAAFDKVWSRKDGLYEKLVFAAEHREAPLEERRGLVVAERLRAQIAKPRILENGQQPDRRGRPCRLQDGSIVFQFTTIWEDMQLSADKVKRTELSEALTKVGAVRYGKHNLKRLGATSLKRLDEMLGIDANVP